MDSSILTLATFIPKLKAYNMMYFNNHFSKMMDIAKFCVKQGKLNKFSAKQLQIGKER